MGGRNLGEIRGGREGELRITEIIAERVASVEVVASSWCTISRHETPRKKLVGETRTIYDPTELGTEH